MCNAWNHSPSCRCGWGGEGHFGKTLHHPPQPRQLMPSYRSLSSYTQPNALCPVCKASVFFYQSHDGGRVFFDELGPPWPKHPCTDNSGQRSSAHQSFSTLASNSSTQRSPKWANSEWKPFIYDDLYASPPPWPHTVIRGWWGGQRLVLYVAADRIEPGVLIHVRSSKVNEYDLSVLYFGAHSQEPVGKIFRGFISPIHPALKPKRTRYTPKGKPSIRDRLEAKIARPNKSQTSKPPKKVKQTVAPLAENKTVLTHHEHRELITTGSYGRLRTVPVSVVTRRVVKLDKS